MKNVLLTSPIALGLAVSFAGCQKKEEAPAAVEANTTEVAPAADANATEANATEANATEANATK